MFDALTSERPYKKRWSNEAALDFMNAHRGTRFDPDCVAALAERIDQVETVQSRFAEEDI